MRRTSKSEVLALSGLVLLAALACKKFGGGSDEETSSASAPASGDSTGVPECDDYLAKYSKCVEDKVPAVAKPGIQQSIDKMRETYRTTAQTPAAKAGLAQGCTQALETTKQAMASYGCTW
ncbi:MAG TPA: hypothetical protein PKD61_23930 [Polyangiaceae bacterium]|nr:hypothetical protein [Polyangiaceae bacterium]